MWHNASLAAPGFSVREFGCQALTGLRRHTEVLLVHAVLRQFQYWVSYGRSQTGQDVLGSAMLKSTHKPSVSLAPLQTGWTEHKAPTGKLRGVYPYNRNNTNNALGRALILLQCRDQRIHILSAHGGAAVPDAPLS